MNSFGASSFLNFVTKTSFRFVQRKRSGDHFSTHRRDTKICASREMGSPSAVGGGIPSARFRNRFLHLAHVVLVVLHTSQCVFLFWIVGSRCPNYASLFVLKARTLPPPPPLLDRSQPQEVLLPQWKCLQTNTLHFCSFFFQHQFQTHDADLPLQFFVHLLCCPPFVVPAHQTFLSSTITLVLTFGHTLDTALMEYFVTNYNNPTLNLIHGNIAVYPFTGAAALPSTQNTHTMHTAISCTFSQPFVNT